MLKQISLFSMVGLYILGGLNHFYNPAFYEAIMPAYIPYHNFLIYSSGVIEIILGMMLVPIATRRVAANLIIAMLIVFFIIHIQMLIDFMNDSTKPLWMAIVRIPLQFVLIWWAYSFRKVKSKH